MREAIVKTDDKGFFYVLIKTSVGVNYILVSKIESSIQADEIKNAFNRAYAEGKEDGKNDLKDNLQDFLETYK